MAARQRQNGEPEAADNVAYRIDRAEALAAGAVGVGAVALFLDTFSSHVALGDAPESVIGVRTLGILHAPGYPSYVLAARAFGSIVAVGSWAFRVNLFSVVCAALVVVTTFLLARSFGAGRIGAAIGAFAFATTASFWFNAGFAKHYAFSALLVTAAALFVTMWHRSGSRVPLIAAGVLLGAGIGAAWELSAIMAVGLALFIGTSGRRPDARTVVITAGSFVGLMLAAWCFILVRAHQDPLLNWGDATNLRRLLALVEQKDFGAGGASFGFGRIGAAVGGLERDFGLGAILLAVIGAVFWWRRLEPPAWVFLGFVGLANLFLVILFAGFNSIQGFGTTVAQGGYLIDTMVVLAVLAALGATTVISTIVERASAADATRPAFLSGGVVVPAVAVVLVAAVIVPSVLVHRTYANQRIPAYADGYGESVLTALPQHSVLLVWGEEFSFPMIYRQVLDHERPDVTVLSVNGIDLAWVRAEFTSRLDLGATLQPESTPQLVTALIAKLRTTRPVFLDTNAMLALSGLVGYRTEGLVGQVVDGVGPHAVSNAPAISTALDNAEVTGGLVGRPSNRVPYRTVFFFYERAHIELAKVYALQNDLAGATTELQRALAIFPSDAATAAVLAQLRAPGGSSALAEVKNL